MQQVSYLIRPMKDKDIPQVADIDREAFPAESLFRPYASYSQEIHNSLARYIVACTEEKPESDREDRKKTPWIKRLFGRREREYLHNTEFVLGFAGLWIMLNEAHIIAIAVRNDYRRMGIGEALLISVIELATRLNANVVTLEVRASNKVAQALYDRYGFHVVGRRPRYYSDNDEDAVLMSTDSISSASFQAQLRKLKQSRRQPHQHG